MAGASGDLAYGYFGSGDQMWGPNGNGWSDINIRTADIGNGGMASYTRYFSVGSGGVAAVANRAHDIAGLTVGTISGSVTVDGTGAPLPGATVDVYDDGGSLYTQMIIDAAGNGSVTLEPGSWRLLATADPYPAVEQWYTVNASSTTNFDFLMGAGGSGGYALGDVLTVIQKPLLNIPTIVESGDSFTINCLADPSTTGWAASLQHGLVTVFLDVDSAVYNASTTWWDIIVDVPVNPLLELYDLRVTANGGIDDTSHNAVQVIAGERVDYYFLHITDTHLPTHMYYTEAGSETDSSEVVDLRTIVQDADIINPVFVLHTGDLIHEGELEDFEERRYYSRSQQILGEFTVPLYLTAGNHDIGGWSSTPPSDGTARRDWWRFYGWSILDNPPPGAPLYTQNYSFNYGGVHYTALEAYNNYDDWRDYIYGQDSFTSGQMSWLSSDLAAASGTSAQVLFYHFDFTNQINLNSLGVEMVLRGHIHSDSGSISSPPYDLATDNVCDGARSYRMIRVSNGVLNPRPTMSAGSSGQNLRVNYWPSNQGVADSVVATITNNQPESFEHGRLIFEMPNTPVGVPDKLISYEVDGGTLVQVDSSGDTGKWYVEVNIPAFSTKVVTAYIAGSSDVPSAARSNLVMYPNHPNPFNPRTTVKYALPAVGHARVSIIDLRGREVKLLVDEVQQAGEQSVVWDGLDRDGHSAPSGTYIAHVSAGGQVRTTKITLAR
jgi:calcineurin-like phosphoesterase family protein/carboxypeptidase family protein/flagellar hook capping protein FlgD